MFLNFRNFDKNILAGYRWLSAHYLPGDKIFLFGMRSYHQVTMAKLDYYKDFRVALTKFALWPE
jgi:hypothetical protein